MNNKYSQAQSNWRIINILKTVFLLLAICFLLALLILAYLLITRNQMQRVLVDNSSKWEQFFFLETGFSTIRVESYISNRHHIDCISTIGTNRTKEWFEQKGFEDIQECDMCVRSIIEFFPGEELSRPVFSMKHPLLPNTYFYYLIESGILIYHDQE